MADLIAQGPEFSQRWRRSLPTDKSVTVGRQSGVWSTPWDDHISRQHVQITWNGTRLLVERMPAARNPVFAHGKAETTFKIAPGEHFVIGNTTFTLSSEKMQVTLDAPHPDREQIFSAAELQQVSFRNAHQRIELLSRLPEVIKNAASENELFVRLVNLLLAGVPQADAAALVAVDISSGWLGSSAAEPPGVDSLGAPVGRPQPPDDAISASNPSHAATTPSVRVLHWDRRRLAGTAFQPSQRLIQQSLAKHETVLHTWTGSQAKDYTESESIDWAYCTPLPGDACRGWALYVAGRFGFSAGRFRTFRRFRFARRH